MSDWIQHGDSSYIDMKNKDIARLSTEVTRLQAERDALGEQLEHDRSLVADCVTKSTAAVNQRHWLTEGRGPYEWDDDKWHEEFKWAAVEFLEAVEPMRKVAADWKGCPQTTEQVAQARIDLKAENATLKAQIDEWTKTIRSTGYDGAQEIVEAYLVLKEKSSWQLITPENLPKAGDEVCAYEEMWAVYSVDCIPESERGCKDWLINGWSHFRSINPPELKEGK